MTADPSDDLRAGREQQTRWRARVATELKAGLESLIETYEADARLKERRDKRWRRPVGE
jgi:hypothetical protein